MARGAFPTGDFGRATSPDLIGTSIGAPAAGAAGALADAAQRFAGKLGKMADTAWQREGREDAARALDTESGTGVPAVLRPGHGVDDDTFNGILRQSHSTARQAEYVQQLGAIELANPDSEAGFTRAHEAMRAAFRPTGDAESDIAFKNFATLQDVQALGRVRTGQERTRQEAVRGAYISTAATAATSLGQAIVSAGLDDAGGRLVGASLTQYAQQLSRYGPKEAFSVGGVTFEADPTRLGVIGADRLAADFDKAQTEARIAWVTAAGDRTQGSMAKLAFAGQVQDRYAAGDPMFAGLDATSFAQLTNRLEADASRAATDERAQLTATTEQARDMLKALEYGGDVDTGDLREAARRSGDPGLIAEVDYRINNGFRVSPRDNLPGGAGAAGVGFEGWVGFLMTDLEGEGVVANDNGRGRSQLGVTEASHPEAWRDGRVDRVEAARIYKSEYWDPIGGDSLPPDLALVAASAAVIGGVQTARSLLAQAGGDAEKFLQLEEARFRSLAAQDAGKYADDLPGWLARLGKERGQLGQRRAQRRAAEGYASDPIGFARGTQTRPALATMAEMDPAQLFDGDAAAVGQFLQSRRATGQQLARQDGVSPNLFASEEVAIIKARIERDPAAIVTLARRAGLSLGGDGARALLSELGRNGVAGADLRLASLSLDPHTQVIVNAAVTGRSLKMQGAPAPDFGKGEDTIADVARASGQALASHPETLAAAVQIAEAAAYADQASGNLRSARYYVNSALGATSNAGRTFGGVSRMNGAVTVAPSWLEADALDDAVSWAAQRWVADGYGPVFANGQPIPATRLRQMQLRATPTGSYQLWNQDAQALVPGRNGRPFEFTLEGEATREALRRELGASVRAR